MGKEKKMSRQNEICHMVVKAAAAAAATVLIIEKFRSNSNRMMIERIRLSLAK